MFQFKDKDGQIGLKYPNYTQFTKVTYIMKEYWKVQRKRMREERPGKS